MTAAAEKAAVAAITPKWEDCGQCGGYGAGPDCEEGSGIPYTCYACRATGRVPFGTADAERLDAARYAGYPTVGAHQAAINEAQNERQRQWAQRQQERATFAHSQDDDIPW